MADTAEQRYHRDPLFKSLVDTIYKAMVDCEYTPTEVREAAMLAAVRYSLRHDILPKLKFDKKIGDYYGWHE